MWADAAAGIHLRAGDVAVQVDTAGHHKPAGGIDPREAASIARPGDDPPSLDPNIIDDAIAAVGGIVDRATDEDKPVGGGEWRRRLWSWQD